MRRDRIVALSECVPRGVPSPLDIGALRLSESHLRWQDEACAAIQNGDRAVLSGDISRFDLIVESISEIFRDFPRARFALLVHAQQAISFRPSRNSLSFFEAIYVATSEEISPSDISQIVTWWNPAWVLVPHAEINLDDWIPRFLLPGRFGRVLLLAPHLPPDEIRLQLEDFSFEHPLIKIQAPPHEWFLASALGPWKSQARKTEQAKVTQDSRVGDDYSLSVVIPFRWTGEVTQVESLAKSLKSIADTFASHDRCEIVISVDRDANCAPFSARDLNLDLADTVFVDVERSTDSADWRAGFIRNCGARATRNRHGFLMFIDADVAIASTLGLSRKLREAAAMDSFDLLQLSDFPEAEPFTTATSSLLAIRTTLFETLGGFSDAFSTYGCEDNFLVWGASKAGAKIQTLPTATIEHLRPRNESDDLVAKMIRLRDSAALMYRMTLDPAVHHHFFSALGPDIWWRALLKRIASHGFLRFFLAPLVFILTLLETRDRKKYLASFAEVFLWKLKRPVLWLRANSWKTELVGHAWRKNAWRVPNFFISRLGAAKIFIEKLWISLRASKFGWNAISWRLQLWSNILGDQIRWRAAVARVRIAGGGLWLLTSFVSLISGIHWLLTVGLGRVLGQIARGLGELRRLFVVYIWVPAIHLWIFLIYIAKRPKAFWEMHSWRLAKVAGDIAAEAWIFREPTEWFRVRAPKFYKWIWRPLLKIRYFLEYHLITRWRNS